jgi:AraC-like DNA-binding protein
LSDFPGSVRQAIRSRLEEGLPDVGRSAGLAGMSVRTLQRRLADEGTSYSRLVDEERFGMAVRKVVAPGTKLIEIALDLGYSDPAHFTRAFRRWAGVAPREFRRQWTRSRAWSGPAVGRSAAESV